MAKIEQDWDRDGFLVITEAKTLKRYDELRSQHPDTEAMGMFFAFSNKQFNEGYQNLVSKGFIKEGDKVYSGPGGSFGTKKAFDDFYDFHKNIDRQIVAECDPQEVYYSEYNNYECCISWDGDLEPIKIIIGLYGVETARTIRRLRAMETIDEILNENKR